MTSNRWVIKTWTGIKCTQALIADFGVYEYSRSQYLKMNDMIQGYHIVCKVTSNFHSKVITL